MLMATDLLKELTDLLRFQGPSCSCPQASSGSPSQLDLNCGLGKEAMCSCPTHPPTLEEVLSAEGPRGPTRPEIHDSTYLQGQGLWNMAVWPIPWNES
ncbi:hypothetical protein P7K49_036918 [Saguinus oedipus]|uniref:Uncharacterized protein n=1 Tax=Saguinus oedipus TaxID=9490 RepID=A0ABQ9TLK5_SAGOE|nr:hypothetical protein P7K49_036918 [Saguinus oedipus]